MLTPENEPPKTAIVIGGGIVGMNCALNLQKRGIATILVDPESAADRRGASWGNAGHIAVEQVEPLASPATIRSFPRRLFWRGGALSLPLRDLGAWLPFSLRLMAAARPRRFAAGKGALTAMLAQALPAWRRLLDGADATHLLREDGHFIVWETVETAAAGRAAWANADTGSARFLDATPEELAALSARIRVPIVGAIRCVGSGQIADLGALALALDARFAALGGAQVKGRVARLDLAGGRASLVLDTGEEMRADLVIVAAGAASGRLLAPLGHKVPIIAERGYHIQNDAPDWPAEFPPVVFEDRSMIVTRFASGLRAASFVEFGRLESPADPRKWARLRDHVAALGLPIALPGDQWTGARPTLPDYLPAIGRSPAASNLYYAFGHQHLGLTLGPMTGEAIGALVSGGKQAVDLAPFDLGRFQGKK